MINQYPFFSVITASYNSGKTIEDTIKSVLEQHFSNFEYIIVDGGSKDRTVEIIKKYEPCFLDKNIQFKWISEKDNGIYDAWNKGVALSSGRWISFLGSDDTYFTNALDLYFEAIKTESDKNFFCSKIEIIDENKQILKTYGEPFSKNLLTRKMSFAQVGAFHRSDLFTAVGLFDPTYKIVGDYDFYLRARDYVNPGFIESCTVKMMNTGISNQAFRALKEAYQLKTNHQLNNKIINLFDFYFTLLKCKVKDLIK